MGQDDLVPYSIPFSKFIAGLFLEKSCYTANEIVNKMSELACIVFL